MWTPEYFVRLVELPRAVHGTVMPNPDGTFDIYINALLPLDQQQAALEHELEHIRLDHLYSENDLREIEAVADGLPTPAAPAAGMKTIPFYPSLDALTDALIASGEIPRMIAAARRAGIRLSWTKDKRVSVQIGHRKGE